MAHKGITSQQCDWSLPAPAAFKADVWTYFGFMTNRVKYSGNTTNLRTHACRHHSDVASNANFKTKRDDPAQRTIEEVNFSKLPATSTHATKITQSVLVFICKDMRPLSVVENKGFRNRIKTLEPRYTVPSRQHITDIALPKLYQEVKATVLDSLSSAETVALTCDSWTSRATESYVTVTAHHITDQWNLQSHVLQTRAMHDSHTGEHICERSLTDAVAEWGLNAKDLVVTDNAANMALTARLAGITHIQCFAHSLNLASQKALKIQSVVQLLGRIRRVTAFFRRSTTASNQLKQKQCLLQLPAHRLITDVITRWNSSYDMIDRFLEQQPAICAALLSAEVRKSEKEIFTLSESDITCAEEVVRALKPMKPATLVMSEESMPTLSIIAPLHAKLVMGAQESVDDTPTVRDIKTAIAEDLGKRYVNERETLWMASTVDPRFKDLPFLSEAETDKQVEEENTTEEAYHPHNKNSFDSIPLPPLKRQRTLRALVDLLGAMFASTSDNTAPKSEHDVAAAEIKRYRDETPLPLTGNPLSWWKDHEQEYPQLSKVARSFLFFSSAGDMVNAQRSVLRADHVDQLVFLHKNLEIEK
uniref:HAT C-terminal dimerisation domain-containing protein n=1 Tax=Haplochromis burtoni TaxID=8153 RepID=A0A3Q2X8X5_HAPBU